MSAQNNIEVILPAVGSVDYEKQLIFALTEFIRAVEDRLIEHEERIKRLEP